MTIPVLPRAGKLASWHLRHMQSNKGTQIVHLHVPLLVRRYMLLKASTGSEADQGFGYAAACFSMYSLFINVAGMLGL
jgi:hypothetical protein